MPDRDLFAPPEEVFKRALQGVTAARIYVSAMACAVVETAIRTAVSYTVERQSVGRPLLDHQGLRWSLVNVATDLEAARLLTLQAAHAVARGEDAQVEAALAKKFAAEMATRSVAACMQAMGAVGLPPSYGFDRLLTSARIAAYVDGTTEMQNEPIGAALLKRYRRLRLMVHLIEAEANAGWPRRSSPAFLLAPSAGLGDDGALSSQPPMAIGTMTRRACGA